MHASSYGRAGEARSKGPKLESRMDTMRPISIFTVFIYVYLNINYWQPRSFQITISWGPEVVSKPP